MPIDNIPITQSAGQQAQDLKNLLNGLWQQRALAEKILAQMQEMNDSSVFTSLETSYGLPSGQGSTVYSLVFSLANGNPGSPSGFGSGAFTQFMNRLN